MGQIGKFIFAPNSKYEKNDVICLLPYWKAKNKTWNDAYFDWGQSRDCKENQLCKTYVNSKMFVDRYSITSQSKKLTHNMYIDHQEICEEGCFFLKFCCNGCMNLKFAACVFWYCYPPPM